MASTLMENCLLRTKKDDAFRFLDTLLSVAATRWPEDLYSRRPQIMEKLSMITALRDTEATTTPDDHHHQISTAAAEKDSENEKAATISCDNDDKGNKRLESSINKLNAQYRAAQLNKRKIQVVEDSQAQKNNKKKMKKNNFITKLRKEAKKTNPTTKIGPRKNFRRSAPQTLTSWIDGQTRMRS